MSRILRALQHLDDTPAAVAETPTHTTPQTHEPVEAALARAEIAAAALEQQSDLPATDPPQAPSPAAPNHAHAYHQLADSILAQLPPAIPSVLMFTSPNDGEGKSETIAPLAAALAQRTPEGVLLLDANLQKPDLASLLGVPASRGLLQVLQGQTTWQLVVQATSAPHLDLLPGVKATAPNVQPPDPSSLRPLLSELRRRYRLVLIDGPALAHAEAASMAGCCDGTYLVVRLNYTARRTLAQAAQLVHDHGGRLLGGVVIAS